MMWQPITLSWIWTHKTNTDQYIDWYIVNHDYHEPQDGTDEWSVIPYSWLKPSQAAQYQKDFLPPARNVPPGTNYWKGFEIKTVCRDDFSPLEKRFCNFGVAYSEVPNFTWTEGEKVGLWHLKNRHHDPEFKQQTIFFEPQTDGDAHAPFSTFAITDFLTDGTSDNRTLGPKGWGHFINAKEYSDDAKPDKNRYVQFKIKHSLNSNTNEKITFFYTDPDQHGESWNIKPTNSKLELMDTNGNWKDEPERKKGVGADDNYGDPGGFYANVFNYGAKEMKKLPSELPSGSRISFKTNRYGGDNFIPKAYFITPACFQWGRLGETNTDEAITVWRKFQVVTSTTFYTYPVRVKDEKGNPAFDIESVTSKDWLRVVIWNRDYGVKGAYDDAFILILPPGPIDKGNPHELLDIANYNQNNPPVNLVSTRSPEGDVWLRDFSDDDIVGIGFHTKISAPESIVHNPNLIFNASNYFLSKQFSGQHLGMSVMEDDKKWAIAGVCDVSLEWQIQDYDQTKGIISWMITHELGHTICYLDHPILNPNDISVMTYYTVNGYPKDEDDNAIPQVQFDIAQLTLMREGYREPVSYIKQKGFFERRSQP